MNYKITAQMLALLGLLGFIGFTAASLWWYPDIAKTLAPAWVLLVRELWREFFGAPGPDNGNGGAPHVSPNS